MATHRVTHYGYCGMAGVPSFAADLAEARECAARRLRYYRRAGYPVATLERGARWEIQEPDGVLMVPDACGTLELVDIRPTCRECGARFEPETRWQVECGCALPCEEY